MKIKVLSWKIRIEDFYPGIEVISQKIILPTSTILDEIAFRNNKTSQRIKYRRMRKKLLEKPEFLMMFCEHHGLDYDDFSTNNAPLPPPLLDPG
jgi:hypothetical protein